LDKWLENCRLYGACCDEMQPAKGGARRSTSPSPKAK
jgi:hypothetical protein